MDDEPSADIPRNTIAKVAWRLLPLIVVSYLVAYIDRSNVAFAALTMNKDLGFTAYLYGWGAGIFFVGYALFEVPSNLVLQRVGARLWIARIMITWGLLSGLMAAVSGPVSFLTLRFLLGVAEAGFFPGIILYFTYWFPARYRARVVAALYLAVPISNAAAALISSAMLGLNGALGLKGWQWVFVGEALPAVLLGILVLCFLTDRPAQATWLKVEERQWLEADLDAERKDVERAGLVGLIQALTDSRVLTLAAIWLLSIVPTYGLTFFLPQIIKELGASNTMTGVLTAIPYAIGVAGPIVVGYSSDRLQERRWHLIGMLTLAAVGLAFAGWWHGSYWALAAVSIAAVGIYGMKPVFWPLPSQFLTGTAAAAGIALIGSIGSLGGYAGPLVVGWIKDSTHSFEASLYFLAACALSSALIAYLAVRATGRKHPRARTDTVLVTNTPNMMAAFGKTESRVIPAREQKALALEGRPRPAMVMPKAGAAG
jgi:ACS family tartrate transporter-like MFS transporter